MSKLLPLCMLLLYIGHASSLGLMPTKMRARSPTKVMSAVTQDLQGLDDIMGGSSGAEDHQDSKEVPVWLRKTGVFLAAALGSGVLVDIVSLKENYAHHSVPRMVPVAHADSTGKMSTKLTARKRYLPRIADGVNKFNALASDESVASTFLRGDKPGYEGFVRAMNLFGASLRVGETPDKISREAEDIVAAFNKEIVKIAKSNKPIINKDDLTPAATKLKQYLEFAEQHAASPIDHYQVNF